MNKTKIEWCDSTWNPVTGCHNGCDYCYARRIAIRYGKEIPDISDYHKENIFIHRLDNKINDNPYPYLFEPTFLPFRLKEPAQKKKPQTIFVCSMADLFGWWVPDEWIEAVFEACEAAPQHRYLFLTKNPKRYAELAIAKVLPIHDNWWYGTTITNKVDNYFDSRYHNTFLSIEPLREKLSTGIGCFNHLNWIIIGAETGNRTGKVIPQKEWIDKICEAALSRPIFMKDSLIPIIGEENMRRELPWKKVGE